jgi:hypothetical protein
MRYTHDFIEFGNNFSLVVRRWVDESFETKSYDKYDDITQELVDCLSSNSDQIQEFLHLIWEDAY